jgi:NAD(P)-dependent dehydrogenase (short-subunit alcohol dehydrogenase family)
VTAPGTMSNARMSTTRMFQEGAAAIVTGAGPGMGRAIAIGFAAHGVDVVIAARRRERLDAVAEEIRALGREPLVVPTDLARAEDCHAVVEQAVARFGRLDHLVQNGHHPGDWQRVADADPEVWRQIFDVNFFGAMHLVQAAAPVMTDGSSIVLVNSGAALRNPPTMGAYAASKAALASLVRTAALELGPTTRVNGVFLGPVSGESLESGAEATARAQGITVEEFFRARAQDLPIRQIPTPEQCAGSVLFFASELAAPVTGQHLSVNGGQWVT